VNGTEAWDIYEDSSGNIWFPIENSGVYCYDGKSFTNFQEAQGLATNAIQCTFEDKEGRLWLGGWKGLFRYDGSAIFSVGKNGPWQ
jgi:streptogramin lyase